MQITITGPRGCGCTSVAILIGRMLKDKNQRVRVVSNSSDSAKFIEGEISHIDEIVLEKVSDIVIVDGIESEHEEEEE